MGNFYVNITLKGPSQSEVAAWLEASGFEAFVSPTQRGMTAVYEAICDSQNDEHIRSFTGSLSQAFDCPALVVLNHDDDVLWYGLYQAGVLDHEYNSAPDYFNEAHVESDGDLEVDDDDVSIPDGGDAQALCAAFSQTADPAEVESILRSTMDDDSYLFAFERHQALAKILGLPTFTVCHGYDDLQQGVFPSGYGEADFVKCLGE